MERGTCTKYYKLTHAHVYYQYLQINHGPWVASLDVTVYDKGCIEMEGLLTEKHTMAASKLLKREFPGLLSTLLSQNDGFSTISLEQNAGFVPEGEYILQCVVPTPNKAYITSSKALRFHFEFKREHWLATSYINGKFTRKLPRSLELQIYQMQW